MSQALLDAISPPTLYAVIDASSSGDNELVAAVSGKRIRLLSYAFVCADAVDVRFESGASGDAKSGVMSFGANGGISNDYNPRGWLETDAGDSLNMELGGAVQVSGHLSYTLVPWETT